MRAAPVMKPVLARAILMAAALGLLAAGASGAESTPPARSPANVRVIRRSGGARPGAPGAVELPRLPPQTLLADSDEKEATVAAGATEAHFTFELINVSGAEVTIRGVQTSCGCTVAQLPPLPWRLPPGGSGPISVTMNVVGRTGLVAKTVTLQTDNGVKTLIVRARVTEPAATPVASAAAAH